MNPILKSSFSTESITLPEVTNDPYNQLKDHVERIVYNPYTDLESFIQEAKRAQSLLPDDVYRALLDLKENHSETNYCLFKGLPLDSPMPDTPGTEFPIKKETFVSEFCLTLFASVLGEVFNYKQEENGNMFRNVRPTQVNESEQTSDGSKVLLELHTETAFHSIIPDYLLLHCLRKDRNDEAKTLISSLKRILPLLDEKTVEELRKPQFLTAVDTSFGNKDGTQYCKAPIPVLYGDLKDQKITYDVYYMQPQTEEGREALKELVEAILAVQEGIVLQPGELLAFDNKRAIHGRSAYKAYYDGQDRWLQRSYVTEDKGFIKTIPLSGRIVTITEF